MLGRSNLSFLYESAATTGTIGRYSFVGAGRALFDDYIANNLLTSLRPFESHQNRRRAWTRGRSITGA